MNKFFFLLFFILSFTKTNAQIDVDIATEICNSLGEFKAVDSSDYVSGRSALRMKLLEEVIQNVPPKYLSKQQNRRNFTTVLHYKVERNLNRFCKNNQIQYAPVFPEYTSVVDFDNVFSLEEFKKLELKINEIRKTKSVDILVLEIDDLYPFNNITDFTDDMLLNWKSGYETNKGKMVIAFSKKLRNIRISTDAASHEIVTDEFLNKVISNQTATNFKSEKFYTGISELLTAIDSQL